MNEDWPSGSDNRTMRVFPADGGECIGVSTVSRLCGANTYRDQLAALATELQLEGDFIVVASYSSRRVFAQPFTAARPKPQIEVTY